jgi:hypothetical protein
MMFTRCGSLAVLANPIGCARAPPSTRTWASRGGVKGGVEGVKEGVGVSLTLTSSVTMSTQNAQRQHPFSPTPCSR